MVAVIVTYNAGPEIQAAVAAVRDQVAGIVVVDNGSDPETRSALHAAAADPALSLILNAGNRGLAAAQNQGIDAALAGGAEWVLLLDQDSRPAPDMVERLLAGADAAAADLAAPRLDRMGALATRVLRADRRWDWRRIAVTEGVVAPALFAIASGSLIRRAALAAAGPLDERLFIDYVDVEYGLRLNERGCRIALVGDAVLRHRLGDPRQHRVAGLQVATTNHGPGRRFTIYRNRCWLWRSRGAVWPGWLIFDVAAAAGDLLRIAMFEHGRAAKLRAALAGLRAGWRGRLGPPAWAVANGGAFDGSAAPVGRRTESEPG